MFGQRSSVQLLSYKNQSKQVLNLIEKQGVANGYKTKTQNKSSLDIMSTLHTNQNHTIADVLDKMH